MIFRLLADAVALLHAAFVVFAVLGGLLVLRWRRLLLVHLSAVAWAALIEFFGWVCPLTPLENFLRARAGDVGYTGGFVEHYVLRALYPPGLTPTMRLTLGALVLVVNVVVYVIIGRRWRRKHSEVA